MSESPTSLNDTLGAGNDVLDHADLEAAAAEQPAPTAAIDAHEAAAPLDAAPAATVHWDGKEALLNHHTLITYDLDRTDPELEVLCVGRELQQIGFRNFADAEGQVCVGPRHPVYVALNVAHQRGCSSCAVDGLSDAEKQHLAPWIAEVADLLPVSLV